MGQKAYWHNLTQRWFNENDLGDAVENSSKGDIIKFSIRGNALIYDLSNQDLSIEDLHEFEHVRKKFLDYFEELHCEKFFNV